MPKSRVVTKTVKTLRKHAKLLRIHADAFDVLAYELDKGADARETQEKRRNRKVSKRG